MDGLTAIAGGGTAIAASFLALTVAWRAPRLFPDDGRPLPVRLARVLDSRALTLTGRAVALLAATSVVGVALTGPPTDQGNLAPWALFVTFWVGLVPASVLFGPVWRRINPLRSLHAALRRSHRPYPERLGHWPAAAWLTGFVWYELVAPDRSDPRLVGVLILGYALANLGLALVPRRHADHRGPDRRTSRPATGAVRRDAAADRARLQRRALLLLLPAGRPDDGHLGQRPVRHGPEPARLHRPPRRLRRHPAPGSPHSSRSTPLCSAISPPPSPPTTWPCAPTHPTAPYAASSPSPPP
jgi:hypothetical protein